DALDPPQEIKDFEILPPGPGGHDDVQRRVDAVLQGEDVPANLTVTELQHARIQAPQDVCIVVLRVGVADGMLQLGRERMSILAVRRSVQVL
nr:hypothetical protein [Tanacetum cinerariifolium]